ncbi:MAG TPA: ACP S-malonyltransferase [Bacteroidota bacterium]|nr:ACP S-malonyltransferase [Bacteroidota bacterium]
MKTALLFPGQGSQYVGMGKDYYLNDEFAKQKYELADNILGYSISDICFNGPIEKLTETRYTQPALFLHSAIIYDLIKNKFEISATAGHSVGEYAALYASDVFSFEDGLKLVAKRGELMFHSGEIEPGTMFAVIGLDEDKVQQVCDKINAENNGVVVPANYNSPGQIVVSGSRDLIRASVNKFKEAGAKIVKELVVSGAFHSPLMQTSANELADFIENTHFNDAKYPVYVNISAKPTRDGNELKKCLIKQLTSPVLWMQTLQNMQNDNIDNYIEVGAGNVLQGLVKRTLNNVNIAGIDSYENCKNYFC